MFYFLLKIVNFGLKWLISLYIADMRNISYLPNHMGTIYSYYTHSPIETIATLLD